MDNHLFKEKFAEDCIECEWKAISPSPKTVYANNMDGNYIFTSGVIKYTNGKSNSFITISFLYNNTIVGSPIEVFLDSTLTFTVSKFNEISITSSAATENEPAEGTILLSTRYPVIE
jgi:hypothetical protein